MLDEKSAENAVVNVDGIKRHGILVLVGGGASKNFKELEVKYKN